MRDTLHSRFLNTETKEDLFYSHVRHCKIQCRCCIILVWFQFRVVTFHLQKSAVLFHILLLKFPNNCEGYCTTCMITYSIFWQTDIPGTTADHILMVSTSPASRRWSGGPKITSSKIVFCKIWTECINVSLPWICSGSSGNMSYTYSQGKTLANTQQKNLTFF